MTFWAVRAGAAGEREDFALENNVVVVGWDGVPDLSALDSRADIKEVLRQIYPGEGDGRLANWAGQLFSFAHRIQINDIVALPRKGSGLVAFGIVSGPYCYVPNGPDMTLHQRPVQWLDKNVPRTNLPQDILYSLGSTLTVFKVERNQAEARIRSMIEGGGLPAAAEPDLHRDAEVDELLQIDIERQARDKMIDYIGSKFKAHNLERLIEEILKSKGYVTSRTGPGADGGIDILAGRGDLGFDKPRLAVQVKSSAAPTDVSSVRELQGVMRTFSADVGLFVSWSGFKGVAPIESRRDFFQLRLWNAEDILDKIIENYDRLPKQVQAELPLKRVWTLVEEDADA